MQAHALVVAVPEAQAQAFITVGEGGNGTRLRNQVHHTEEF
jgi:hypothetical protein